MCSLAYTSLWKVHWGKEESKSHSSLFLLYNDIMSCQSETKSLNITNRVNCQPHGIALQLPTSSNNRFIQEKDWGTMWVCVCVCIRGQGVTLAAHAINILQKQRKHFFFSSILTRKSLLKKKDWSQSTPYEAARAGILLWKHDQMTYLHIHKSAHIHINHMCTYRFPYITCKPEHTHKFTDHMAFQLQSSVIKCRMKK